MHRFFIHAITAMLVTAAGAATAFAADPCTGFKWDVTKEHALFQGSPTALQAGRDGASAPSIENNHLYELKLNPQDKVTFAVPPGKKMLTDGAYAGLAAFKVNVTAAYRVAVDVPFWIDVVADGRLVASKDFQGQQGCDSPHKIVEYELEAGKPLVLQVSGSTKATVRLTVTQTPQPKT